VAAPQIGAVHRRQAPGNPAVAVLLAEVLPVVLRLSRDRLRAAAPLADRKAAARHGVRAAAVQPAAVAVVAADAEEEVGDENKEHEQNPNPLCSCYEKFDSNSSVTPTAILLLLLLHFGGE